MSKGFFKGFAAGLLCCVLLLGIVACGSDPTENRLTEKTSPTPKLTPSVNLKETNYQTKLDEITALLEEYYYEDVDYDAIADSIYHGALEGVGDPYTTYYNPDELAAFMESSDGAYAGFGTRVTLTDDGYTQIVEVFPNGPADKAGFLPGDLIVEVDGESVVGMQLDLVAAKMRGEIGSKVSVTFYREGEDDYRTVSVTRDRVEIPTVESQMLDSGIGYIKVAEFDDVTSTQFNNAVKSLSQAGMKALIVDLRNNPGGLLSTVSSMLSRILPKGDLLVYMKDKNGNREDHYSDSMLTVDVPMAVLMNDYSASASEVFAGCLQDYGKAILVGTQSFGKGIVQTMLQLSDGSAIKVTVSAYYTPNGRNIHKTGLTPDIEVELDPELRKLTKIPVEQDNQIKAAVDALLPKIR